MATIPSEDRLLRLRETYRRMQGGGAPREDLRAKLRAMRAGQAVGDAGASDAGSAAQAVWDANRLPMTSGDLSRAVTDPRDGVRLGRPVDLPVGALYGLADLPRQGADALAAVTRAAADGSGGLLRPVLDPVADAAKSYADMTDTVFALGELEARRRGLPARPDSVLGAVGSGAPQLAMATGVGAVTGGLGAPAALGSFGAVSAAPVVGSTYREAVRETGNASAAAAEALGAGAITGATSLIPGAAILRRVPGGSGILSAIERHAMGRLGAAATAEAAQEYVEGASQDVLAIGMRQGRMPTADEVGAILTSRDRVMDVVAGGVLGGAARAGVEAGRGLAERPVSRGTPVPGDAPTPDRTDKTPSGTVQSPVSGTGAQPTDAVRMPPEPTDPTGAGAAPSDAGISPGSPSPVLSPPPPADLGQESNESQNLEELTTKDLRARARSVRARDRGTREELIRAIREKEGAGRPVPAREQSVSREDAAPLGSPTLSPRSRSASGVEAAASLQQTSTPTERLPDTPEPPSPRASEATSSPQSTSPEPDVPDFAADIARDEAAAAARGKAAPTEPLKTPTVADAISDSDESQTSARNAMMDKDRASLGLESLDGPTRRSWGRALGEAKKSDLVEQAMSIAQKTIGTPRTLTDTETAALVIRASGIKTRHAELMSEVQKASDPADIRAKGEEAARLEQDFDLLSQALRVAGTETGRALAARKLTIDQDLQLLPTLARAKAAKGAELSAKERAGLEDAISKLEAMTKRAETAERRLAEQQAERTIVRKGPGREPGRHRTAQQRESDIARLLAKTNELLSKGCR